MNHRMWSALLSLLAGASPAPAQGFSTGYPVPVPQPADIPYTISCQYMPRPIWPSHDTEILFHNQRDGIKATEGQRIPLLGLYSGGDPEVLDWQILWATSAGISNFVFNDYWVKGVDSPVYETSLGSFLEARYQGFMTFSMQFNGSRREALDPLVSPEAARAIFLDGVIPYYVERYFSRSNYLRVEGKPVVQILSLGAVFGAANASQIRATLDEADATIRRLSGSEWAGAYWITSDLGTGSMDFSIVAAAGFDAVHPYYVAPMVWPNGDRTNWPITLEDPEERLGNFHWRKRPGLPFEAAVASSKVLHADALDQAKTTGVKYVPTISTDFDSRAVPSSVKHLYFEKQRPWKYADLLHHVRVLADDCTECLPVCSNTGKPMIGVGPWNEQGESNCVEPGFSAFTLPPPFFYAEPNPFALLDVVAAEFGAEASHDRPSADRTFSPGFPAKKREWLFEDPSSVDAWQSLGDSGLSWGPDETLVVRGFATQFLDGGGNVVTLPVVLLTPLETEALPNQVVRVVLRIDQGASILESVLFEWEGSDYTDEAAVFLSALEPMHRSYGNLGGAPLTNCAPPGSPPWLPCRDLGDGFMELLVNVGFDPAQTRWQGTLRQIGLTFVASQEGPFQVSIRSLRIEG